MSHSKKAARKSAPKKPRSAPAPAVPASSSRPKVRLTAQGEKQVMAAVRRAARATPPPRSSFVPRVETWALDRLRTLEANPREHSDAQLDEIAASIQAFGFLVPLVVDEKRGRILAGNGRFAAALRLGLAEVPVIPVGHLSVGEQKLFVIADNKIALDAAWNPRVLAEYFTEIERLGLDPTASFFTRREIDAILEEFSPTKPARWDAAPPRPRHAVSRLGDLWQLGNHRVLCRDATAPDALSEVLAGRPADAVWTDPPYNVNYSAAAGDLMNDDLGDDEFEALLAAALSGMFAVLAPGGPIYLAHPDTGGLVFRSAFVAAGFKLSGCLIWRKNALVLGRSDYHWRHEPVLYGWKPGAAHPWYGARDQTTIVEFDGPPFAQVEENAWQLVLGETALIVRGENLTVTPARGTVFFEDKPASSPDHPTMKPVPLIERMLLNSVRAGGRVLDPFGGAGSTLIACERNGWFGHLVELDPGYVDVIVKRWQEFTGREATLEGSGGTFADVARDRAGE